MENSIPKFRQSSIIPEKSGYLSEKLKTLTPEKMGFIDRFYYNLIIQILASDSCSQRYFFYLFKNLVLIPT